jgi:predicted  nucleic acid-binding Zn-ribbon protein
MQKATHDDRIVMHSVVSKNSGGKFIAVLSDDSIDRDGEKMSSEALNKVMKSDGYTVILYDHENKVMNQVGEWTNKRIETIDGHTALVAEPKFYESNPNAKILKGMLEEGAKMGVSIGAIPKDYRMEKINGKDTRVYTDLELLEASFVAIPSNRHGMAMAVAKMAKSIKTYDEVNKMEKHEELQKSLEDVNKQLSAKTEAFDELTKNFEGVNKQLESVTKELETVQETVKALTVEKETLAEEVENKESEKAELQKNLEEAQKVAKHKGNVTLQEDEAREQLEKQVKESVDKAYSHLAN